MKIMVSGSGRPVYFLARSLLDNGHEVTLIIREVEEAKKLASQLPNAVVIHGNASHPDVLADAGALGQDVFIALGPDDATNLIACQQAARRFHIPRTLAVVNDPRNEQVFRRLGIHQTFSATRLIVTAIEQEVEVDQLVSSIPIEAGKLQVSELALTPGDPAVGKAVRELRLPEQCILAAVVRRGEPIIPRGDTVLQAYDRIVLVVLPEAFNEAASAICTTEQCFPKVNQHV